MAPSIEIMQTRSEESMSIDGNENRKREISVTNIDLPDESGKYNTVEGVMRIDLNGISGEDMRDQRLIIESAITKGRISVPVSSSGSGHYQVDGNMEVKVDVPRARKLRDKKKSQEPYYPPRYGNSI